MQIQQSIMGPLSSALGSLTGVTYGTNPGSQQSRMLAAQDVGLRAMGGPVTRNKPYIVGERGPELFVPNGSGNVVSNGDMAGGGVTVNQTINLSTGVQQTVRTEVMQMLPQIAEASKSAVLDARRRGGSFAKAFGA